VELAVEILGGCWEFDAGLAAQLNEGDAEVA
jgi:hypothetical protein